MHVLSLLTCCVCVPACTLQCFAPAAARPAHARRAERCECCEHYWLDGLRVDGMSAYIGVQLCPCHFACVPRVCARLLCMLCHGTNGRRLASTRPCQGDISLHSLLCHIADSAKRCVEVRSLARDFVHAGHPQKFRQQVAWSPITTALNLRFSRSKNFCMHWRCSLDSAPAHTYSYRSLCRQLAAPGRHSAGPAAGRLMDRIGLLLAAVAVLLRGAAGAPTIGSALPFTPGGFTSTNLGFSTGQIMPSAAVVFGRSSSGPIYPWAVYPHPAIKPPSGGLLWGFQGDMNVYSANSGRLTIRPVTGSSNAAMLPQVASFLAIPAYNLKWALITTWENATFFGAGSAEKNTVQMLVAAGEGTRASNTFACFFYERLELPSGLATSPVAALIYNDSNIPSSPTYALPGSGTPSIVSLATSSGGWLNIGQASRPGTWCFTVHDACAASDAGCSNVLPSLSPTCGANAAVQTVTTGGAASTTSYGVCTCNTAFAVAAGESIEVEGCTEALTCTGSPWQVVPNALPFINCSSSTPWGGNCSTTCRSGYVANNVAGAAGLVATCTEGYWTMPDTTPATPPACVRAASPCIGLPAGGNADWPAGCNGTAFNASCAGTCSAGFQGSPSARCGSNSTFVVVTACSPITCGVPSADNATFPPACNGTAISGTCSGLCATGLVGDASAVCGSNGQWSVTSTCSVPVTCGTPSGGNATWAGTCTGAAAGASCLGDCLSGMSGTATATCTSTGTWAIASTCAQVICASAPSHPNTTWPSSCAEALAGSTCTGGDCAPGFAGDATATCTINATWLITSSCTQSTVLCLSIPAAGNATFPATCNGTAAGESCSGSCSTGFLGSATAACGTDRAWTVSSTCAPAPVPSFPTQPPSITANTTTSAAVVTWATPVATDGTSTPPNVTCSPASGSLFPIGSSTITCRATSALGGATAQTTFSVTVVPLVTSCSGQPPAAASATWSCATPVPDNGSCTATCTGTASDPPLTDTCVQSLWVLNAGFCGNSSPTFAYTVTGITGVTAAAITDFCDALYESLRASNAIPGLGTTILRPNFVCRLSESGSRRRHLRRLQSPVVSRTTILVAIQNAGGPLPPVQQLQAAMNSPATMSSLAENLASTPTFTSTADNPVSLGPSDTAGNLVAPPQIVSNCPVTLTSGLAATCFNPQQLVATFTYTSPAGVGTGTFSAHIAGQPAVQCTPSPALTSSAQPGGLAVTVSCSKSDGTAFSAGSYTVYLTAGYAGDSSGTCISSSRTAFATVVTPGLTLRAPGSLPSACSGSGSVSISFPYTTSQASSAQLTAVATPSAPSVTCAAQVKTDAVAVTCTGAIPSGQLSVTLRVTLQRPGCTDSSGIVAERTAVVAPVCCASGALYARPSGGRCFRDGRCPIGSTAVVATGPASGTVMAGVTTGCSTNRATAVGAITAVCAAGNTMVFNVTNAKVSQLTTEFWTSCSSSGAGTRILNPCAGWRIVPRPGPVNALQPAVTSDALNTYTSWRLALPRGCTCSILQWSVRQAGLYGGC